MILLVILEKLIFNQEAGYILRSFISCEKLGALPEYNGSRWLK